MAANTVPIYSKAGQIEWAPAELKTANTAMDGTGTVAIIFTAGADGGRVERVRCKANGTNVATVLRLFINNGGDTTTAANNNLYAEKITFVTYMLFIGLGLLGLLTLSSPFLATTRLKNVQQIKADMQNRISLVNSKVIPPLDVDDKVIVYCDLVGTSSLLTFRNLTILSSIVPGLLNVFLSSTTLEIDMCLGEVNYAYEAANVTLCKLDFEYQGISLETSIFGSSFVSFPILIIIAFFLYSLIRTILLLHKYRAKFFAVGLKFSDQLGLYPILKDILWNAVIVYILFFIIPIRHISCFISTLTI
jgi:hypothetical protein